MSRAPVRRAQLVAPFGVGAMMVAPDGVSLITAGLDHWYKREDVETNSEIVDVTEFPSRSGDSSVRSASPTSGFRRTSGSRAHPEPPPNVYLTVPARPLPAMALLPWLPPVQ